MGQVFGNGIGTDVYMREAKSDKSTISSALFLCVSLYPADVVMSVCRRCVGRVATEMGGNAGISGGVYWSNKANTLIKIDLPFPIFKLQAYIIC